MLDLDTVLITKKEVQTQALVAGEYEEEVNDRQNRLEGMNQLLLAMTSVILIGAGGLGEKFAEMLARMGIGRLVIIDGDNINLPNLAIQKYSPSQIGMNKAIALVDNLINNCTGNTSLVGYSYYFPIVLIDYPEALLDGNFIACLVDNEAAKYEASAYGLQLGIPVILAGISTSNRLAAVFVQEPGGPCYNCVYPKGDVKDDDERFMCAYPSVIYSHTTITGIAVYATIARIMGWKTHWNEYILSLDTQNYTYTHKKRDDCEVCGGRA